MPLPLISFWCGVCAFVLALLALPLWASGYGIILGILLDFLALPVWLVALITGLPGLIDEEKGEYALMGLGLVILAPLLTYLVYSSWSFAELFRFRG